MKKTCDTCAKRHDCRKHIGIQFGFCNTDYQPDYTVPAVDLINTLADIVIEQTGEAGPLAERLLDSLDRDTLEYYGLGWLADLLPDEDDSPEEAAWHDGSAEQSCSDCPDSECTGHCMSCAYRSF